MITTLPLTLSVIIPARNEIYLEKTIQNILENMRGDTEILVVLDGYIPDPQIITNSNKVKFIYYEESIGQRQAINAAAKQSTSTFIMKLDAHCALDEGFDVKLMANCEYDWTVVPRMYNLDIATWLPKLHKRTDYMYIGLRENGELRAEYYQNGHRQPKNDKEIDDIMCCMGPCFFMHRERFWELGGCDEAHGSWGQQGIEVACKAWLSGGKLVVNKKTWFSHWFRGDVGFPYPMSGKACSYARKHSKDLWLNNKWPQQVRPFEFLLDKFNPPNWENHEMKQNITEEDRRQHQEFYYKNVHLTGNDPRWRGVKMIKMPTDIVLYQMTIWANKPDFIVEIGTAFGASAVMFADFLEMTGKGMVISIDPTPRGPLPEHPRITYLKGDSKSPEIISAVKELVGDGSVMVSIDGNHARSQVKWELHHYQHIVTKGQYMVVEDCYGRKGELVGPGEARDWFMNNNRRFVLDPVEERFVYGFTKGGWLRKK